MAEASPERMNLWATETSLLLHATKRCCSGTGERKKVRDHFDPSYFDDPRFQLCSIAREATDAGE